MNEDEEDDEEEEDKSAYDDNPKMAWLFVAAIVPCGGAPLKILQTSMGVPEGGEIEIEKRREEKN